jgi:hypothetical protein
MTVAELLLTRAGVVSLQPGEHNTAPPLLQVVDLELAALGYAPSFRLRQRLGTLAPEDLGRTLTWICRVLAAHRGAPQTHTPLFRDFPRGVPADTFDLWIRKMLIHFVQAPDQPCLFCRRTGTTHVLNPCLHVVCDRCFDGANYSACPVCEHHVDRASPFFLPSAERLPSPDERVTFTLLDLGEGEEPEARRLFLALRARPQALAPADRDALATILAAYGAAVLDWLPEEIPVRETSAAIFGTLLTDGAPETILARARAHMTGATDVLRLLAAYSGEDPALQGQTLARRERLRRSEVSAGEGRPPATIYRFRMAPLRRPLRRCLLEILNSFDPQHVVEDMARHRSYWIWAGQFLHPLEYAGRFPHVARAFAALRQTRPGPDALGDLLRDSTAQPALELTARGAYRALTFYARLERAAAAGDGLAFAGLLAARPGELARRLDHALRLALAAGQSPEAIVAAYVERTPLLSPQVLITLLGLLPHRTAPAPIRLFWPKGQIARGVSAPDGRLLLPPSLIEPLVEATACELLRRFAGKPAFACAVIDDALAAVVAPFNERTASPAAVVLPRGSRVPLPAGQFLRLFLHWCQPKRGGATTDLDLSVAFYGADWGYVGVCSYYNLRFPGTPPRRPGLIPRPQRTNTPEIATSSGDLRDAPYPHGATEFVDLHLDRARDAGIRYAVMVVNSYVGMSFSALERGYAGVMARHDAEGLHFDPRTVRLKFDLQGANGIFLPMVVDLHEGLLHWLDIYARGRVALNNVETSRAAIQTICPQTIAYFGSGVRLSLRDLALLHAAARCDTVCLRGLAGARVLRRGPGETPLAFYRRLRAGGTAEEHATLPPSTGSVFACLYDGDLDLPDGSTCYALFRERQTSVIAAGDLLA